MKRAVAFLDILGFKRMVEEIPLEELASKYERLIDQALYSIVRDRQMPQNLSPSNTLCKQFIFSDSIILIANEDSPDSFVDLILSIWRIMQVSIATRMPIRGGVTYGDIYLNEKWNIVLGKALTEAYVLEKKQDWIGVVIDKSAEVRYSDLFKEDKSDFYNELLCKYRIPFKDGQFKDLRAVNWRINFLSSVGIKILFENPTLAPDVERKINNTLSFSKYIRERGYLYPDIEPFPNRNVGRLTTPFRTWRRLLSIIFLTKILCL